MKKSNQVTWGLSVLIIGILLLAADRLFVAAANASYSSSMTILTTVALFFILIGAVWLFRTAFK